MKRDKSDYTIQAVSHALDLLEQFSGDTEELGVTELSKKLKLHKNNVFRLLATLENRGYIEQNKSSENYRLGVKALELGQNYLKQTDLIRQAQGVVAELVERCNETGYVAVLRDSEVVYLDSVESSRTVRVVSRVGHRLPTYCTAAGKVLLAFGGEDGLKKGMPARLEKRTSRTITNREALSEHLAEVVSRGYAVDDEECEEGVKCIGAAIFDYNRGVVGSVSVSGPSNRMTPERIDNELAPMLMEAAQEVSRRLGYQPNRGMAD